MKATALSLLACLAAPALAAPRNADPDWPCQQLKVAELSVASYWSGPPINAASDWQQNPGVAALVGVVAQRRLPIEQATLRIDAFAKAAGAEKSRLLPMVFAGLFDVLSHERANIINGLDRFGQRQKTLAGNLRDDSEILRAAQAATPTDDAKIAELTQRLLWDSQVFEQRRQSLGPACNVATVIEQRLYSLAQAIQQVLD